MASSSAPVLAHGYSCVSCKKRKSRCNRQLPCSNCVQMSIECVPGTRASYPARRRPRKQAQRQSPAVETQTADPEEVEHAPAFGQKFAQNLWHGLGHEFTRVKVDGSSKNDDESCTGDGLIFDPVSMLFAGSFNFDLVQLYPEPAHAFLLWQTYLHRVDPLTKIIHTPSMQMEVAKAVQDLHSLNGETIALLFAIYTAAVTSLAEDECIRSFGQQKSILLPQYAAATQQALAAAGLMRNTSMLVLQAFAIHLIPLRRLVEPKNLWLWTGLALRMCIQLGLDRRDQPAKGSVFDQQMGKRVLCYAAMADSRAAKDSGLSHASQISELTSSLPLPDNLNDADLVPGMMEAPVGRAGATEMLHCLVRYEVFNFITVRGKMLNNPIIPLHERDRILDEFRHKIEENYFQHYDPAIYLQFVAMTAFKSSLCRIRLMVHHPSQYKDKGASLPQSEKILLFNATLTMLELDVAAHSSRESLRFLWHMMDVFQVDALVFMLIESRDELPGPLLDKAWSLLPRIYYYHQELFDMDKKLSKEGAKLVLQAWEARQANLSRNNLSSQPTPDLVEQLKSNIMFCVPSDSNQHQDQALVQPAAFSSWHAGSTNDGASSLPQILGDSFDVAAELNGSTENDLLGFGYWQ